MKYNEKRMNPISFKFDKRDTGAWCLSCFRNVSLTKSYIELHEFLNFKYNDTRTLEI